MEGLGLSVRPGSAGISAGRLLPHVLEATGHVQRLHVVPDRAIYLLTIVASNLRDMGRLDTSRPPFDRALAIAQAQLGPDHPQSLAARANLAYWLGAAGQPAQAARPERRLVGNERRVLGPPHPETLTARRNSA